MSDFRSTMRWTRLSRLILARDLRRCHWCGGQATQADHIVPISQHGHPHSQPCARCWDPRGITAACRPCNSARPPHRGDCGVCSDAARRGGFLVGVPAQEVGSPGTELEFAL